MKYFKTTFMWIIVLVAVAGYSYLDFEKTRVEEKRKEEATRLLPFTPAEVLSILIEKEGAEPIELERWEEGWKIVSPIKAKADDKVVEKFLGYVTDSRNDAEYVMDPDPTPDRLAEFGLAKPSVRLTLKVGKDLVAHTLVFGSRAPTMGVAFAQLAGQKPVYRVLANARAEADKDVFHFRDKTVLRLQPVMIDQISITRKDGAILAKLPDNGKWTLEKPIRARADHIKVFELISSFANAKVKAFASEEKKDLGKYGLDKPSVELRFWLAGDSEPTVRLDIGDRSPEKRGYFCSMSDRDNIFILPEDIVQSIPRHANELRSRELFFFDKDRLQRIEIRGGDKSIAMVKDMEKDWRRGGPDGEKMDFNVVNEFLDDLMSVKIKEFVTDDINDMSRYGLDPARFSLLIWPEGSSVPMSLSVGVKTPAGDVFARSGSESEVIALDSRIERILETYF